MILRVNNYKYFMLSTCTRDSYKFYGKCFKSKITAAGKKVNSARGVKRELKLDDKVNMTKKRKGQKYEE
jgi:hypothetical protein